MTPPISSDIVETNKMVKELDKELFRKVVEYLGIASEKLQDANVKKTLADLLTKFRNETPSSMELLHAAESSVVINLTKPEGSNIRGYDLTKEYLPIEFIVDNIELPFFYSVGFESNINKVYKIKDSTSKDVKISSKDFDLPLDIDPGVYVLKIAVDTDRDKLFHNQARAVVLQEIKIVAVKEETTPVRPNKPKTPTKIKKPKRTAKTINKLSKEERQIIQDLMDDFQNIKDDLKDVSPRAMLNKIPKIINDLRKLNNTLQKLDKDNPGIEEIAALIDGLNDKKKNIKTVYDENKDYSADARKVVTSTALFYNNKRAIVDHISAVALENVCNETVLLIEDIEENIQDYASAKLQQAESLDTNLLEFLRFLRSVKWNSITRTSLNYIFKRVQLITDKDASIEIKAYMYYIELIFYLYDSKIHPEALLAHTKDLKSLTGELGYYGNDAYKDLYEIVNLLKKEIEARAP